MTKSRHDVHETTMDFALPRHSEFAKHRMGSLNGTVSDEDGEPIIHAQVIADQSLGLTTVTDFRWILQP